MTHRTRRPLGVVGERVAANVRAVRKSRGLSTRALERRLDEVGWRIIASGITRIEMGERHVDTDDLTALALALNCSPNRLLMPPFSAAESEVNVAGDVKAGYGEAWAWATGEAPLTRFDDGEHARLFSIYNAPHHYGQ